MINYHAMIKNKRKALGMTQNQLAKIIDVSQPFIADIENGKKNPSVDVFFQICEVLEITIFPDEE